MYPFHRQLQHRNNNTSARTQHGLNEHAGRSSRTRNSKEKEWRSESEPPSPTNEPHPTRHHRTCQELGLDVPNDKNNALRAKEKVLLSSICSSDECRFQDNKLRLGPNRYNVFECLQKASDMSSRMLEENKKQTKERNKQHITEKTKTGTENQSHGKDNTSDENNLLSSPEYPHIEKNNFVLNRPQLEVGDIEDPSCVSSDKLVTKSLVLCNVSSSTSRISNEQFSTNNQKVELKPVQKIMDEWTPTNERNEVLTLNESTCFTKLDTNQKQEHSGETATPLPEIVKDDIKEEDLEFVELDNAITVLESFHSKGESDVANIPIDLFTAVELKKVVLGSSTAKFSPQWLGQGFAFNTNHKLRHGFVQRKGGACGVLAPVQAFLLKILLFEEGACSCMEPLRPTSSEARSALVRALADILWRAGLGESAVLSLCSEVKHLFTSTKYCQDGLTEVLNFTFLKSRELLEENIKNNLNQFTNATGNGCLLLVFSVVLSRGLHRVKNDMDECSPLIGQNGHCTLELVNLLLTGSAVSNVFDNNLQVDSCWLRGVNARADIGFLSLFEHYNSCQVGSYLKTPRYPIWVVCSENHFSVLFSCQRELVSDWRAEKRFHLYYYDTMAHWKDEIKLTIDTTGLHTQGRSERQKIPSLEHCIRTKWKDAAIDWNGYNPH